MHWSLRVIAPLTADTEPSLAIICDQPPRKYIFNVGEGTTRACIQHKFGLSKTSAILLTRMHMQQIGGFPGLIMSLADMGTQDLQVCGPQGLVHYVASTRKYCRRTLLGVKLDECVATPPLDSTPSPIIKDENLLIYAVPILPSSTAVRRRHSTSSSSDSSRKRKRDRTPDSPSKHLETGYASPSNLREDEAAVFEEEPGRSVHDAEAIRRKVVEGMFRPPGVSYPTAPGTNQYNDVDVDVPEVSGSARATPYHLPNGFLPQATYPSSVVAYVVVGMPVRGKFDVQKTKALGVPQGPLWGELGRGETVVTPKGDTITPEMCLGPFRPPTACIFVHCPDPSYIDGVVASTSLNPTTYGPDVVLHVIVHRLGDGVLEDERYKTWMNSFGPDVHHLVASSLYSPNPVVFTSAATTQMRLAELDPEIFRLPHHSLAPTKPLSSVSGLPPKTIALRHDLEFKMTPPSEPRPPLVTAEDTFHPALAAREQGTLPNPFADVYNQAKARVAAQPHADASPGSDVVITTLGTGSAMPSKYRNVSGNLIQIPKWGNVLFDCGEGTWGQMARQFGPDTLARTSDAVADRPCEDVDDVVQNLKCIFISHIHGDHHMGLAKILGRRRALSPAPKEPVYVLGPLSVLHYLTEHDQLEDLGMTDKSAVRFINARRFCVGDSEAENVGVDEISLESALGLNSTTTMRVHHRVQCFGIVLRHKDGWSVAYSGDTMPCEDLVKGGQDATVLIHEATMADDEAEMARAKAHSTFGQAIDVGRRMRAKNILLTHFSQRYPKLPELNLGAPRTSMLDESLEEAASEDTAGTIPTREAPVAIAFDCASLRIGSLWKMEKYMDALATTFPAEEEVPSEADPMASASSRPPSPTKGKKGKAKTSGKASAAAV